MNIHHRLHAHVHATILQFLNYKLPRNQRSFLIPKTKFGGMKLKRKPLLKHASPHVTRFLVRISAHTNIADYNLLPNDNLVPRVLNLARPMSAHNLAT
jgi:hypothetical protein